MVDLMDVKEQVDLDYSRARRRALVGRSPPRNVKEVKSMSGLRKLSGK